MDLVFVQGDQRTKGTRGEFLEHDAVGWLVAFKDFGLDESGVGCCFSELLSDLFLGLSESEGPTRVSTQIELCRRISRCGGSLGLGKEVGEENLVVLAARDWVKSLDRSEEITVGQYRVTFFALLGCRDIPRDKLSTLVNELVESVLTVGSALSPDDWLEIVSTILHLTCVCTHAGLVVDPGSVLGDALSVRLHVSLLEVVGKLLHVLIVWQERLGLGTWTGSARTQCAVGRSEYD